MGGDAPGDGPALMSSFFLLVFTLSIPFWIPPFCSAVAASILVYRAQGIAGVTGCSSDRWITGQSKTGPGWFRSSS
jgi:hypothetical protein